MSFYGPWSKNFGAFKQSVASIPSQYQASFDAISKDTLDKICHPTALHIWETDSDIDNLLQLTSVIARLCDLSVRKQAGMAESKDECMLIIAEEKHGRDNFARVCELTKYLVGVDGKKHLDGTIYAYDRIVVVRGWNNSQSGAKETEDVTKRINVAIDRTLKMQGTGGDGKWRIVWHHGPVVHHLLYWINNTTPILRSSIIAITVAAALDLSNGLNPSSLGMSNQLPDMQRLEDYAKRLNVGVVFLDSTAQHISYECLGTYMYFYAYYINTFLPRSLLQPHLEKGQDELMTFAYQIRGASKLTYGSDVVKMVQSHLTPKRWALQCVEKDSYSKDKCRAAGNESAIHNACQLADAPFALWSSGNKIPAFTRLAVGPASSVAEVGEYFICAPVNIDFPNAQLRAANASPFRIMLVKAAQDPNKVTSRIQGLMMAVLERVRLEKGQPIISGDVKEMWAEVMKACLWALESSKGRVPKGVEEKLAYVVEKLKNGMWTHTVGLGERQASGAVNTGQGNVVAGPSAGWGQGAVGPQNAGGGWH